jgi:hypothetical protein
MRNNELLEKMRQAFVCFAQEVTKHRQVCRLAEPARARKKQDLAGIRKHIANEKRLVDKVVSRLAKQTKIRLTNSGDELFHGCGAHFRVGLPVCQVCLVKFVGTAATKTVSGLRVGQFERCEPFGGGRVERDAAFMRAQSLPVLGAHRQKIVDNDQNICPHVMNQPMLATWPIPT